MEIRDIEEELARDLFKTPTYARDIYSYLQVRGGSTVCVCVLEGGGASWHFTTRCSLHTFSLTFLYFDLHLTQFYSHPLTT